MAKVKPIKPSEVGAAKSKEIPDGVLEAFNELIVKNWDGHSATVLQKDAEKLAAKKTGLKAGVLYESHYMDVEEIYQKAGWIVDYDKPAYCESYDATYTFSKKG